MVNQIAKKRFKVIEKLLNSVSKIADKNFTQEKYIFILRQFLYTATYSFNSFIE